MMFCSDLDEEDMPENWLVDYAAFSLLLL
jgi:hypothetical protein